MAFKFARVLEPTPMVLPFEGQGITWMGDHSGASGAPGMGWDTNAD